MTSTRFLFASEKRLVRASNEDSAWRQPDREGGGEGGRERGKRERERVCVCVCVGDDLDPHLLL